MDGESQRGELFFQRKQLDTMETPANDAPFTPNRQSVLPTLTSAGFTFAGGSHVNQKPSSRCLIKSVALSRVALLAGKNLTARFLTAPICEGINIEMEACLSGLEPLMVTALTVML